MIFYNLQAFIAVTILAVIHIYGSKSKSLGSLWHTWFLSAAGGVSVAYVFVELLPRLDASKEVVNKFWHSVNIYDKHVYIVAFLGFVFYYGVEGISRNAKNRQREKTAFLISLFSYSLFNFLIGYEVADINDPLVRPLILFTFAVGLHYFINDHALTKLHRDAYESLGRWVLAIALYFGWLAGLLTEIPEHYIAYGVAFIAGGMILNTLRYELPAQPKHGYLAFALGGIFYCWILSYKG